MVSPHTSHCEMKTQRKCQGHWSPKCRCMTKTRSQRRDKASNVSNVSKPLKPAKKLATLDTIYASLPNVYEKDIDYELSEKKNARKLYGKRIKLLTPKIISKYLKPGQSFYGLSGQTWSSVDTLAEKKKQIEKMTFLGFQKSSGEPVIKFKYGTYEVQLSFTKDKEYYGTGSGSDPIFIFFD